VAAWLNRLGAICLCIHILISYWLEHHWSHLAAIEHVADRTHQAIGVRSGLGIYANFFTAAVWMFSAYFGGPHRRRSGSPQARIFRSRISGFNFLSELYLWTMFLQASIVFAQPWTALTFGLSAALVLLSLYHLPARTNHRDSQANELSQSE
jgi:hypothetical protein